MEKKVKIDSRRKITVPKTFLVSGASAFRAFLKKNGEILLVPIVEMSYQEKVTLHEKAEKNG